MSFKIGDTVMLKSGGPVMTVCDVQDGKAACAWFTIYDPTTLHTLENIDVQILRAADPPTNVE